jgi:hypothetical protein
MSPVGAIFYVTLPKEIRSVPLKSFRSTVYLRKNNKNSKHINQKKSPYFKSKLNRFAHGECPLTLSLAVS